MKPENDHAPAFDAPVRLSGLRVRTEPGAVASFRREAGAGPIIGVVPLTFPFCWLTLPAVRAAVVRMIGDGFLPIHEAQSFEYQRGLDLDADYDFTVELQRSANPPRLTLRGAIATPQGEIQGRLETVLRIAPLAVEPAP